jgi:lipopolysaccharide export LptBFGC system permease protein LptF
MKKILRALQRWFEHYGLVKILLAFIIIIIAVAIGRKFPRIQTICDWIGVISSGYLLLTFVVFFIAGIVNIAKDIIAAIKVKRNKE